MSAVTRSYAVLRWAEQFTSSLSTGRHHHRPDVPIERSIYEQPQRSSEAHMRVRHALSAALVRCTKFYIVHTLHARILSSTPMHCARLATRAVLFSRPTDIQYIWSVVRCVPIISTDRRTKVAWWRRLYGCLLNIATENPARRENTIHGNCESKHTDEGRSMVCQVSAYLDRVMSGEASRVEGV